MAIQPYLFFEGRCEEALEFYKRALDAKVGMLMRYKDSPEPPREGCTPPDPNKVMHASFTVGDSTILASDGNAQGKPQFKGFGISFTVKSESDAQRYFEALTAGGQVLMPLDKTFFSPKFGMVADRFGIMWMIMVER